MGGQPVMTRGCRSALCCRRVRRRFSGPAALRCCSAPAVPRLPACGVTGGSLRAVQDRGRASVLERRWGEACLLVLTKLSRRQLCAPCAG